MSDELDYFDKIIDLSVACDNKDYDFISKYIFSDRNNYFHNFMNREQLDVYRYVQNQCSFMLCIKHNKLDILKRLNVEGVDTNFKLNDKCWFNYLNDNFYDILDYIIENIEINPNLQDNEGKH